MPSSKEYSDAIHYTGKGAERATCGESKWNRSSFDVTRITCRRCMWLIAIALLDQLGVARPPAPAPVRGIGVTKVPA